MMPFLVAIVAIVSFSGGLVTSHLIWVQRMKNTQRLQRMLDDARRRGQIERDGTKRSGLEPPTWMP